MAISHGYLRYAFVIAFVLTVLGAFALFQPDLEFLLFDLIEKFHLSVAALGAIAFYGEITLILITLVLAVALLLARFRRT